MPTEPKISVVVATFKRAPILARTLDHIVKQQYDPAAFEVIVVDDGSEDGTDAVVHAAAASAPVAIHYLSHENRGPGYTQNRGIRAARGEIVLLLADDIFLTPGALEAHMRRHDSHPDPRVAVLGNAVQSPELGGTGFLRGWDAFGMNRFDHLEELPYFLFWAFNLSFKREFMLSHGMFREALGRGGPPAHEDTELGYRLHRRGMVLLFAKEALGYHYHPSTLRQAARRYYERGLNYGELITLAPDPLLTVFFHVLTPGSLGSYRRALRVCSWCSGRERSFAWHILRHAMRGLVFNRLTVQIIWRPLLTRGDHADALARAIPARLYGPYLFYHFLAGIADARHRFSLSDRHSLIGAPE